MSIILFLLLLCFLICIGIFISIVFKYINLKLIASNKIGNLYFGGNYLKKFAIIVPYGNLNLDENRSEQLDRFIDHMSNILPKKHNFDIIISEQIKPNKYFNRGQLLNIGAKYAIENCKSALLITHDVDMLPDKILVNEYILAIENDFTCLAPENSNKKYYLKGIKSICGGAISSILSDIYIKLNGYPNNFWGWGGEDLALIRRVKSNNIFFTFNKNGEYKNTDEQRQTENTHEDKMNFLKNNKISNMYRNELLIDDILNWKKNGYGQLNNLNYKSDIEDVVKLKNNINLIRIKNELDEFNLEETIQQNDKIYKIINK